MYPVYFILVLTGSAASPILTATCLSFSIHLLHNIINFVFPWHYRFSIPVLLRTFNDLLGHLSSIIPFTCPYHRRCLVSIWSVLVIIILCSHFHKIGNIFYISVVIKLLYKITNITFNFDGYILCCKYVWAQLYDCYNQIIGIIFTGNGTARRRHYWKRSQVMFKYVVKVNLKCKLDVLINIIQFIIIWVFKYRNHRYH